MFLDVAQSASIGISVSMPQTTDSSAPPYASTSNIDRALAALGAALTESDDNHYHLVRDLNAILLNYDQRLSALADTVEPLTRQNDQLHAILRFFQDRNHETTAALSSFKAAINTLYDSVRRIETLAAECTDCHCQDNVCTEHFFSI